MVEETSIPQRSTQEHLAELKALNWTFSHGSIEKLQEILEKILCLRVPRLQQIGLDELIKMSKNSSHSCPEMEQCFETISKRVGMFEVFTSGTHDRMSDLIRGLSALGGKRLDTYGVLEFLEVAQKNEEVSEEIIDGLEKLVKKVLIYYWKVFSQENVDEMERLIRKLKQASPDFLNALKIWRLYDAAQKNPQAPQAIRENLDALRSREKEVREKKCFKEAKKRAKEHFNDIFKKDKFYGKTSQTRNPFFDH